MKIAPREAYGRALVELGRENDDIVVLDADVAKASMTSLFKEAFPDRFFDLGIAESDIMATGAGFALAGKIPFVNAYANFLLGNGWEQLRLSICYSRQNVKIVGHNIGASSGKDGPTHLPLEDIALARVIPGLLVLEPADAIETRKATRALAAYAGPAYMRVGRMPTPVVTREDDPFVLGRANICRPGQDVTIVACGCMTAKALEAAAELAARGLEAEVINLHTIKPLDEEILLASARKTRAVATAEEHSVCGGMGGAVAEFLAARCPVPVRAIGSQDIFGICASYEDIQEFFGMTSAKIVEEAETACAMRDGRPAAPRC
ncbi:MAG: transketolase family protein [Gracilibacteraceae bacterium]|jgi:transketolase|nr:transketolase family protein [Gracilibacteraceae bacterium]